jgi:tetratricopeptide (TPR) repeat protein
MSRRMTRTASIWRLAAAAAIGLAIAHNAPAARADAAAGSLAFERGDYVRAMAEWRSAAERDDPDAEFGLGMLYELGAGELRQNYKEADRWYQKAAEHDNIGAQYRLALIRSAGGDDLPADLVEAYKWILLASEKGLATDVKAQLGEVLNRAQQAEAQKRAAAWKEAQAAKKVETAAAPAPASVPTPSGTAGPAIPPPRSAGTTTTTTTTGKSGGCPGWPFPTLPCTEQFPALPGAGAPAQRAPAPAPEPKR